MSRTAKFSSIMTALALAAIGITGCTATPSAAPEKSETSPATTPVAEASPTQAAEPVADASPTPEPTEPDPCPRMSEFYSSTGGLYWERRGTLRDLGAREFAQGEVTFDADGNPVTYTVASGDVEAVIAERLCAYPNLGSMNHVRMIQPGQVLWLTPDPSIPWLSSFAVDDAPEGFQQLPYEQAFEAAGDAVDAGDVDAVREIWNDTLKGMFVNQETIDAVQQVVDSGDLDALRQLFS
ncbi:hypothetical protein [Microbacterium gorillae]|uniref:hypothetical protein n=1 Tax=Microbacterium gorillae TaxID=1231063 RepID=UPI003D954EBD